MTKNLLCLFLAFQALLGLVSAQDVITKYGSSLQPIEVKAGEVCEIIAMKGDVVVSQQEDIDGSGNQRFYISQNNAGFQSFGQIFPVAGPFWLLVGPYGNQGAVSYRIRPNTSSSTATPANAVVIPTDATGSVQIILESSTDLVTWTQANPGTYGASTTKRFFRIRAVNQ